MRDVLYSIRSPKDIQSLNNSQLISLADDIREFLIDRVSKSGGHLASNLGVVELTLALFKNFDFSKDKIIWDVGHQSYVHKLLTGRIEEFNNLRQYGGMSGFPKRSESKYDFFDTGHSSTSLSAACGMARARDILKKNNNVVAVIGDGALTGGMALEALNDIGYKKSRVIIILNDNQMSISKNVGGLSSYLSKIRLDPGYNKLKAEINSTLNHSNVGKNIATSITKIKDSIKQLVVPSMFFEDMGLKYLGPIDGHNIKELSEVFSRAKEIEGPVIIHTVTQKGKGYDYAEQNPNKFHGVGPFDYESGEFVKSSGKNYSKIFGDELVSLAKQDERIVAITAAMPDGTGLKNFSKEFPNRFFDVGIAEQHAVTLSAGMALEGLKPFFAVYSTFLQRGYDQVLHDVCIQNIPVVFCIDRAGIVGEDGETHQGIFDISYLSHIPNMTIISPKCMDEVGAILKWASEYNSPLAIRYPRGGDLNLSLKPLNKIILGQWEKLRAGKKVVIIATGRMVQHSLIAAEEFKKESGEDVTVINATFIKPIDKKMIYELAQDEFDFITVEDNMILGGLGSLILNELNKINFKGKIVTLGYDDNFIPHGDVNILYAKNKLDPMGIKESIKSLMK
ncbi:1-deoxy-D-xylulose-5-phosphate synthase [Clostridium tarantellae]|uniref:1-deoxy-D-xylulose-5-phosphate synthase n=1 Tax=Clostridium tarantellae TaxID=39493 RepID=A0A6I1MKN3_9CLOT|nr:1-deoxy-D-xylulose-5-phosphate synthase [Clostridium tarantellae]MPQ42752.1 1-deoxy-D-xylulose-5-phosphate synthase [Clostridium tarantellae]